MSEAHYLALIYKISWVSLKLFRTKTKSRVFISCLFLPVSFQQKALLCNPHVCVSVVMSALRLKSEMVWRQSATIEGLSSLHFLMVLHFSVSFCDEYFQFGASLDKIHKINRCRALSVMRSDAELLSGPAEWHYAAPVACSAAVLQWGAWQSGSGKGSPGFRSLEPGASLTDIMRRHRNGGAKFPGCCIQQFGANILLKVGGFLYFKSKNPCHKYQDSLYLKLDISNDDNYLQTWMPLTTSAALIIIPSQ